MSVLETGFPYRELNSVERERIWTFCGGIPVDNPGRVRDFLRFSGHPLLKVQPLNFYLSKFNAAVVAKVLENSPHLQGDDAERAFNRGALLYAAMFKEANSVDTLPFQLRAVAELGDEEDVDFLMSSIQDIREVSDFESVLGCYESALAKNGVERQMVEAGGGAVHRLVVKSIEVDK